MFSNAARQECCGNGLRYQEQVQDIMELTASAGPPPAYPEIPGIRLGSLIS